MYCKKCGREIQDGWKICPYCRMVLDQEEKIVMDKKYEIDKSVKRRESIKGNINSNTKRRHKKRKHSAKKKIILAIALLLGIVFISHLRSSNESTNKETSVEQGDIKEGFGTTDDNELAELYARESDSGRTVMDALSDTIWSSKYFNNYIIQMGIDFSKYAKIAQNQLKEVMNLSEEYPFLYCSILFGKFELGNDINEGKDDYAEYVYQGEQKKGQPHGHGTLYRILISPTLFDDTFVIAPMYIGEFKDGRFHGEGIEYFQFESGSEDIYMRLLKSFDNPQSAVGEYFNYLQYIGEFEKGERSGEGIEFVYPDFEFFMGLLAEGDKTTLNGLIVYVGDFKDNELNGDAEEYIDGKLSYKGEMKDSKYHGQGTLYDMNGEIEYKGKWKNGEKVE